MGQAWIDGPKQKGSWNYDMWDGVNRFYAHVFRGAQRYHYGDIGGLKRPNVWSKLKICAYDNNSEEHNGINWGNWDFTGVFPDIKIWESVKGNKKDSDELFSTTVHEIAHASHIQLMNGGEIQFNQVSDRIIESWAVAVQWQITSMEYREKGIPDFAGPFYENTNIYKLQNAYQRWTSSGSEKYSPLFIDLVDDFNQFDNFGKFGVVVNDKVKGYTLPWIESSILKHVYGVPSLSKKLKENKPSGVTDSQIDELLKNY